ncbi:serine/threonine protein kinase [Nocardiopsis sp. CNT-189]|uniref:serine/threonine-protein kinase n=1 Tax=Nocardiopsis oceanisediminis TaxID=2816862 RepID=UPI003B29BECF
MGDEETGTEQQTVGDYRLVRRLGRGGFGEVFLGEAPDGRRAAVKLLHATWAGDADMRRRFAAEVEQARKVSGFCIAAILGADPEAERPWIATEYIDGPTLQDAVAEDGPRGGADLHRLAVSTATALAAIHGAGVVHRDLKPENILLAADGPRVIDFGIARAVETTSVTASGVVGTVGYMAPEQLEGLRLTPAVDVFAWGAVLAFAATGREAFSAPTQVARITRILSGAPDTEGIAEPLLPIVLACLEKDPARRPTARGLLDLLLDAPAAGGSAAPQAAAGGAAAEVSADGATRVQGADGATRVEGADGATRVQGAADPTRVEPAEAPGTRQYTALAPGEAGPGAPATRQYTRLAGEEGHAASALAPPSAPGAPPAGPPTPPPAGPYPSGAVHPSPPPYIPPGPGTPPPYTPVPSAGPSGAVPAYAPGPPGETPPYWFAGAKYTEPGALAEAMQRDWGHAVRVFGDDGARDALGSWLISDARDTAVDRSLFRRRPDDANIALAWFIAQLRPDLPPVFRGRDASLAGLREQFSDTQALFTGAPPANDLLLVARPEVLRAMALHQGPDAEDRRRLLHDLEEADQAAVEFQRRLRSGTSRLSGPPIDSARVLAHLLHPEQVAGPPPQGDADAAELHALLWAPVEQARGARRAGMAAVLRSMSGLVATVAKERAEWREALSRAQAEQGTAAEEWEREARLYTLHRRLKVPVWVLVIALVVAAGIGGAAGSVAGWTGSVFLLWAGARIAAMGVTGSMGPRNGYPSAVQAAQARHQQAEAHVVRLRQGVDAMEADLRALRALPSAP